MEKKILLIPLLFSAFVVAGCSASGGGGGSGSDPETPTKHIVTLSKENYSTYLNIDIRATTVTTSITVHDLTCTGSLSYAYYDNCVLTLKLGTESTKDYVLTAGGYLTYTRVYSNSVKDDVVNAKGTITYWL